MENKIYLGDASSSSMMDKYGVKVGIVDENELSVQELYAHPQSPWVSVKDRLPSVEKNLFGDVTHPSVLVLTASHAGSVSVNRWSGREWLYTGDVDYWMPIPAIPKEYEEYIDKKKGSLT